MNPFRYHETLVVRPHDQRDPDALARAGQTCRFEKYSRGAFGTPFAVVSFPDGKRVYFRDEDLDVVRPEQLPLSEVQR
jgi:hypothetical protein